MDQTIEPTPSAPRVARVRGAEITVNDRARPFNLQRSFAVASLICIGLISVTTAVVQSRFVAEHLMKRDAVITMEFIQRISNSDNPQEIFDSARAHDEASLGQFFAELARMPDVVRANIFSADRVVIWSTAEELIGRTDEDNDELERALRGEPVYELVDRREENKPEHDFFAEDVNEFLENYLPIWDTRGERVIGVAEVYKTPSVVFQALMEGRALTWSLALMGGLFLYATLFWIVRRASQVIEDQQQRLVETETLAAVGEMASAVAHGIRNPLASIRSSAELSLETSDEADERERASDTIREVDRLTQWIRELLLFARPERGQLDPLNLNELLDESLDAFHNMMQAQGIRLERDTPEPSRPLRGDEALLNHAISCLISNAIEAMPEGGTLSVRLRSDARAITLEIQDTGQGIDQEHLRQIFKPFKTTKRAGIGLGMVLVKRIIERHQGRVRVQSRTGIGTLVQLDFPRD